MAILTKDQAKQKTDDELVIDLAPIFKALRRKFYWILIVAIVFGALAYFGTKVLVVPKYRTMFRVYVNNQQDSSEKTSITNSDLVASRSLAATYSEIIKGRTVLTTAAERVGINVGYGSLSSMVNVSTGTTTEIITINVTTVSPEFSLSYADSIIEVAQEQISQIVDGSSMRVIDAPYLPTGIYSPNYKRNAVLGAVLGALLTALIIVLQAVLDNRVKDEQTLEERFGVAILGSIPNQTAASKAGGHYYSYGYEKAGQGEHKK